jgi:predicted O-methyltransferase YrrM
VLREYDARIAQERALAEHLGEAEFIRRVNEFLLPIGPESGQCLNILIKAANSQCILEVGTSLWTLDGVARGGGAQLAARW